MQQASNIARIYLWLACIVALVMVGFAHKPVTAYPPEARLPAYELPDGTFASICFDEEDSSHHTVKQLGCDACRLSGAILVPAPAGLAGPAIAFSVEVRVFERRQRLARALYPPNSGPRAPPAISMFG